MSATECSSELFAEMVRFEDATNDGYGCAAGTVAEQAPLRGDYDAYSAGKTEVERLSLTTGTWFVCGRASSTGPAIRQFPQDWTNRRVAA